MRSCLRMGRPPGFCGNALEVAGETRGVFVGRPVLWGLAVDGASGAQHALAMTLAGRPTLASIDATLQRPG